eukprot:TRINITY_DN1064_c2_g1_i2.p1 TRINITY_DN1064_c2_g1~~TRINITY_DN1064_c2_g1_i2.p1  ORF type:complete len:956 (+),score=432.93 TRINITY_DN1064_c2_g1_i2:97-2964(+)
MFGFFSSKPPPATASAPVDLPSDIGIEGGSKVELHFACEKLKNMDTFSKSDPQVIVFAKDIRTNKYNEIGRTERIDDNLNPVFSKSIVVEYHFERVQELRFSVFDIDSESTRIDDHDFIGSVDTTLGEIMGARGQSKNFALKNPGSSDHKLGIIKVSGEEVRDLKYTVTFQLKASKLDKKDLFGKSDPFIRILRKKLDGTYDAVHKTEVIKNTLDPAWRTFEISIQRLCNGDMNRPLRFDCIDWNPSGTEDFIGSTEITLNDLQQRYQAGRNFLSLPLINPQLPARKKGYQRSGSLDFVQFSITQQHTFLDYIRGGCEINLVVAIDYTQSNGEPEQPTSLHYQRSGANEYVSAIQAVGSVLANYDSDRNFPVFGFGAKLKPKGEISFLFPLNGNHSNPEVHDVQGIIDAYRQSFRNLSLWGPTNFEPTIRKAASLAPHCTQHSQKYTILLILTDGEITDMAKTAAAIVDASGQPLSIVIVGVGNADFANMEILDGDEHPLQSNGRKTQRDIVQFVPFREYKNAHPTKIAEVTLAEIPVQFLSYMKSRNIVPNPPVAPVYDSFRSFASYPAAAGGPYPSSSSSSSSSVYPPGPGAILGGASAADIASRSQGPVGSSSAYPGQTAASVAHDALTPEQQKAAAIAQAALSQGQSQSNLQYPPGPGAIGMNPAQNVYPPGPGAIGLQNAGQMPPAPGAIGMQPQNAFPPAPGAIGMQPQNAFPPAPGAIGMQNTGQMPPAPGAIAMQPQNVGQMPPAPGAIAMQPQNVGQMPPAPGAIGMQPQNPSQMMPQMMPMGMPMGQMPMGMPMGMPMMPMGGDPNAPMDPAQQQQMMQMMQAYQMQMFQMMQQMQSMGQMPMMPGQMQSMGQMPMMPGQMQSMGQMPMMPGQMMPGQMMPGQMMPGQMPYQQQQFAPQGQMPYQQQQQFAPQGQMPPQNQAAQPQAQDQQQSQGQTPPPQSPSN